VAKKEVLLSTVYVSIPSLYDTELIPTVLNIFEEASDPKNIFVGVSLLDLNDELLKKFKKETAKHSENIRLEFLEMNDDNYKEMFGVGFGRKRALSFYNNEDYFLQIDPHSMFSKNWDTTLISKFHEAQKHVKNKKVVLTSYAGAYTFDSFGNRTFIERNLESAVYYSRLQYPFFSNAGRYYGVIPRWDILPEKNLNSLPGKFLPAVKFNANFSFGDKNFAKNTGLYEDACFFEEEILQTLALIKLGYTLVYPVFDEPVVCHMYTDLWVGKHGYRISMSDLWPEYQLELASRTTNQYTSYIKSPDNLSAVKEYSKYARMHPFKGSMYNRPYIPEYFLNSEVKYDREA
jgi:hypothetical protein